MNRMMFALKLYRIQVRMIVGPKHRYRKEYDDALDTVKIRQHWLYLYDALEGPKADEVCEALKKWVVAYQAKQEEDLSNFLGNDMCMQAHVNEHQLKEELHVLIYGKHYKEGKDGFTE
jgi:hypothetical protein